MLIIFEIYNVQKYNMSMKPNYTFISIILRIIQEGKKKRKKIIKQLEKCINLLENYILNLENMKKK